MLTGTIPNQDQYLINYSDDNIDNIKNILKIYHLFTNLDTSTYIDITEELPNLNAVVYNQDTSSSFNVTHIGGTGNGWISVENGKAVVYDTLIEIDSTSQIDLNDDSHWIYAINPLDAGTDTTAFGALVIFYAGDASAKYYFARDPLDIQEETFNGKLCVVKYIKAIKISGDISTVELSNTSYVTDEEVIETPGWIGRVIEIPHWRNFVADGGELD